jgi:hypothetical protein
MALHSIAHLISCILNRNLAGIIIVKRSLDDASKVAVVTHNKHSMNMHPSMNSLDGEFLSSV